ncbi:MauE/DoxX family redox-associated membrane protein [Streptomyces sp. NPDC046931]|uniref:MauE/DoxX family redox-associated membrane protein n=1 Tax=Streptomyces sp. NPDC046931 TaxID=3154806 RepID=UPI0033FD4D3F
MEFAAMCCRILLVVVFAVAVVSKLRSADAFGAFVRSVQGLAALSPHRSRAVARVVAGAEVAGVVLLVLPSRMAMVGFALVGCLLGAFALAMAASLRRGVRVPCRCFGASTRSTGPLQLVRNGFLMAVAAGGAVGTVHGLPKSPGGLAVACATGLVLGVVVTNLDDISELLRDAFPVAARKGHR